MTAARPLRDVFTDLTGDEEARRAHAADPEGYLSAQGHPDLPADLVAEAVVSFADAAPPPVAEHLAPYVMEHSSVPYGEEVGPPAEGWLDLLATAPPVDAYEEPRPDDPGAWFGDADGLDDGAPGGGDLDFGLGDLGAGAAGAGLAAVVFGAGNDQPDRSGADPIDTDPADLDDLALADMARSGTEPHHVSDPHDPGLDDNGLDDHGLDDGLDDGGGDLPDS